MSSHATTVSHAVTNKPAPSTFADHLHELKARFFWIAVYFVIASASAYPFFYHIVYVLTLPLDGQKLYYMTPAGGLAFIIKVCMYVGVIAILPVLIYHLYKFIAPVMKEVNARRVLGYTVASSLLAVSGIVFAYFVTLPAAIQFLTNINFDQISSMLTIDSYMSFVISYILVGALLFQLPLIMLMINSFTQLPPGKLMNYQRHMIVVSFVIAAIVSPTPDVVNQTILAAPMIVMYQIGIIAVWLRNRKRTKKATSTSHVRTASLPQSSTKQDAPLLHPHSGTTSVLAAAPTSRDRRPGTVMDIAPPSSGVVPAPPSTQAIRRSGSLDGVRTSSRGRHFHQLARPQSVSPRATYRLAPLRRSTSGLIPTI